jgi:hypothetical protein
LSYRPALPANYIKYHGFWNLPASDYTSLTVDIFYSQKYNTGMSFERISPTAFSFNVNEENVAFYKAAAESVQGKAYVQGKADEYFSNEKDEYLEVPSGQVRLLLRVPSYFDFWNCLGKLEAARNSF